MNGTRKTAAEPGADVAVPHECRTIADLATPRSNLPDSTAAPAILTLARDLYFMPQSAHFASKSQSFVKWLSIESPSQEQYPQ